MSSSSPKIKPLFFRISCVGTMVELCGEEIGERLRWVMTVPVMECDVDGGVYASQLPLPSSVSTVSGPLSSCGKEIDKGGR